MNVEGLRHALEQIVGAAEDVSTSDRHGAVLVLLEDLDDGPGLVLTRRQADLSSHPGQISFPGGRIDPGETIEQAALREAHEEIGLRPESVEVLGRLPSFYIPPSRYWMTAVVARWVEPHELAPNEAEVAEVLHVATSTLRDREVWRAVPLSARGSTWAWQLAPGTLLWGATAVVTGVLLQVMDPGWSGGVNPQDLPQDRRVRPWEDPDATGISAAQGRARRRLRDVPDVVADAEHDADPHRDDLAVALHRAITSIDRRGDGPVLVLAGPGTAGDAGRSLASLITESGADRVSLLDVDRDAGWDRLGEQMTQAGIVVDALGDRHTHRVADARTDAAIAALPRTSAPIVAVDIPTGMHPDSGLEGPSVSADVTVAIGGLVPAHTMPGSLPFVGDLYLVTADGELLRPTTVDRARAWGE